MPDQPAATTSPVKVRKLGHVVYKVSDMERSVKFYTEVLNFQVTDHNPVGMVFLTACGDHHTIALVPAGPDAGPADRNGIGIHHFAMEVASLDELFACREYFQRHGVPVVWEGRRGPGCNVGIEIHDPDGYQIELYCGIDQVAPGGRVRPASQFRPARSLEEARDNPVPAHW